MFVLLLSSLSSSPAQQVHGDTNRFGGTLNQFASTGDLIKALLDPETEQAMWFIFCSTVVLITGKLFFGALRGTVVHKILLEYLLKIMTPNIGNDWPHSETIIVPPSSGKHKTTVIFLHGLGDGSGYWENGVQALKMEDTKFILPAAPILPVSINMNIQMPAWYNIIGLEDDSPEDDEGIARACRDLVDIVQQEIDEFGIAPSNIAIGGFSQGGAVVLHTVYRKGFLKHQVGGVLTMCSYMPDGGDEGRERARGKGECRNPLLFRTWDGRYHGKVFVRRTVVEAAEQRRGTGHVQDLPRHRPHVHSRNAGRCFAVFEDVRVEEERQSRR